MYCPQVYDRRIVILGRSGPSVNNHVGFRLWMTRNLDVLCKVKVLSNWLLIQRAIGHGIRDTGSVCTH